MNEKELRPILFTRTELGYLIRKLETHGDYSRVLKYRITKKLIESERLIWPILKSNPLTKSWVHAFIGKIVTAGSNGVTISCNAKEEGLKPLIITRWRARGDLNPGPTA
ncbi:MAG: hypothetical protein HXX80_00355 [Nitrososphaerales archaeon]|nr:hypothetical protein [Nitrososphaerales archaeon]